MMRGDNGGDERGGWGGGWVMRGSVCESERVRWC